MNASAAGLLTKAKENKGSANKVAAELLEEIDALIKSSITAAVSEEIVIEKSENSNYATITADVALLFNKVSWNAGMTKIDEILREISSNSPKSIQVSVPAVSESYEFDAIFRENFPNQENSRRVLIFRGFNDDKSQSEWVEYTLNVDIFREFLSLLGNGYELLMAITDDKGAILESETKNIPLPVFVMFSQNLIFTPFFPTDGNSLQLHDLSEQMYAFATGTQKSFGVRFQTIIETNVLIKVTILCFHCNRINNIHVISPPWSLSSSSVACHGSTNSAKYIQSKSTFTNVAKLVSKQPLEE